MAKKKLTLEDMLVPKEETPYEVPENWCWVKLGSVIKVSSGKNLTKSKMNKDGTIPVYGGNGFVGYHDDFNIEESKIIIGRVGANCGNVHITASKGWITDNAFIVSYNEKLLDKTYLYYLLSECDLGKYSNSSAQPVISGQKIYDVAIQVPPLAEQERIVKRIESLFEKVDKARKLVDEARDGFEKRRAAILEKAFNGELTAKWREENGIKFNEEKVALSEVVNINPKKPKLEVDDDQICSFIPMVAVSDINGKIESMEERHYSKVKKGYTYFEEGDVLFAKITPCMENGKSCIAEGLSNGFGFGTTEFHVLRCNEKVLNKYIYYLVRAKWFREEAKQHMTGAVGQQRVPKTYLEEYDVWIPSIDEQKEVVKLLEYVLDKEFEIEGICEIDYKVELLKKAILGRAFRGELGSNNLNEESSIEILKNLI